MNLTHTHTHNISTLYPECRFLVKLRGKLLQQSISKKEKERSKKGKKSLVQYSLMFIPSLSLIVPSPYIAETEKSGSRRKRGSGEEKNYYKRKYDGKSKR